MKTVGNHARKVFMSVILLVVVGTVLTAAPRDAGANEVGTNVLHPNGNVYDQLLLTKAVATFGADLGQVTRISYVDLSDDIIQVEFSGKGSVALTLENATGPSVASKYNQPGVLYMRGHARIRITGSDATTNINIFSVGPANVANQALIKPGEVYDGVADLAELEIVADSQNPNGSIFGGIYAGNASFWAHAGRTGIFAPNVHVQNVVRIADMQAFDNASPALVFGKNSQFGELQVSHGGTLVQPNERLIAAEYPFAISLAGVGGPVFSVGFGPGDPIAPGVYRHRYFIGPSGERLLWIVPSPTGS